MARHGNVRVIPAGDKYRVSVSHYRDQLRIFVVIVNQLYALSRFRHIKISVHFLQHFRVLMWRPTGPIARLGVRESNHQPARLHVLRNQQVHFACATLATRSKL